MKMYLSLLGIMISPFWGLWIYKLTGYESMGIISGTLFGVICACSAMVIIVEKIK